MKSKIWFITGASRGFGALITKAALARGDAVVATARNAAAISDAFGPHPQLLALQLDVTNEAQAHAAVTQAIERFGRIDVLVNNAGYGLFGLLNVTRAVLPRLRAQRRGHVINLSSIGGIASSSGWGVYCATKFAVEALSESMAIELEALGVRTTVVEPGYFRTEFLSGTSLASTAARIDDYAETVGAMRSFATGADGQQPGDPQRLAAAMLELVDAPTPPRRLPLGSDTVRRIGEKHREVEAELETWRALAVSTDFLAA